MSLKTLFTESEVEVCVPGLGNRSLDCISQKECWNHEVSVEGDTTYMWLNLPHNLCRLIIQPSLSRFKVTATRLMPSWLTHISTWLLHLGAGCVLVTVLPRKISVSRKIRPWRIQWHTFYAFDFSYRNSLGFRVVNDGTSSSVFDYRWIVCGWHWISGGIKKTWVLSTTTW